MVRTISKRMSSTRPIVAVAALIAHTVIVVTDIVTVVAGQIEVERISTKRERTIGG